MTPVPSDSARLTRPACCDRPAVPGVPRYRSFRSRLLLACSSPAPSCASAASISATPDRRCNSARVICASVVASSATGAPMPLRWRAINSAPRRAASASKPSKSPVTCSASVGVKAARVRRPRPISLSTAPKASCVEAISATLVGPISTALAARRASERVSQPGTPFGINGMTKRPSVAIGTLIPSCSARMSLTCGHRVARSDSGTARRGPRVSPPAVPRVTGNTSESPPSPQVRISAASTMVFQPPTSAPSSFSLGAPFCNSAMSVVVPPISATMAVCAPARKAAPARLAAGPDSTVSTGRERAKSARNSEPSPLTTINGHSSCRSVMMDSVAAINRSRRLIRRAFRTAVRARRGPPSAEDNSWLHVTGQDVMSRMMSRARRSWAGLRVAKCAATA